MSELPRWKSHKVVRAAKVMQSSSNDARETWSVKLSTGDIRVLDGKRVPDGEIPTGGYFVEYEDGYASWSPCAQFEAGYTLHDPNDWRGRLVAEKDELEGRLAGLRTFIPTASFEGLGIGHKGLLRRQEALMSELSDVLGQRLALSDS